MGCRAVDGTFVLQEWRQMKKEGFSTTVIADAQTGAAVGFIDCRDSEPVYLSLFLLDAALQGKGLGTELYREFEEMQRGAKASESTWWTIMKGTLFRFGNGGALKKDKKSRWNGAARLPVPV